MSNSDQDILEKNSCNDNVGSINVSKSANDRDNTSIAAS